MGEVLLQSITRLPLPNEFGTNKPVILALTCAIFSTTIFKTFQFVPSLLDSGCPRQAFLTTNIGCGPFHDQNRL